MSDIFAVAAAERGRIIAALLDYARELDRQGQSSTSPRLREYANGGAEWCRLLAAMVKDGRL